MDHKNKTFNFINKSGEIESLFSRRFTFKTEKVLEDRFGKDFVATAEELKKAPRITLDMVKEDFPKLLTGDLEAIDWEEQEKDLILSVYFFFLLYEQNAIWRHLLQENDVLASIIGIMTKTLSSNPEISFQIQN